jgi:phosphogluconate dehydratase
MLTAKSWVNGMVGLIASGGSTNLTIHLIAMAEACGFKITLEDIDELSSIVPTITNVYPNGSADVNQFHSAGGVAAFIGSLLDGGYLFADVHTLLGKDLTIYRNNIEIKNNELTWETPSKILDQSIIRDSNNPFNSTGGLKLIDGNIGRGIIKTSSLKSSITHIEGHAIVFNNQEEVLEAFGLGKLNKDCIIVVRGQGPSANGMPELHKLTSPLNVIQSKGYTVAILTDGRMSGASGSVPAVIHISPEANDGGMIGKILNNDKIKIDIDSGTFELQVDIKTLNERKSYQVPNISDGIGRELFKSFREKVKSVETGASIF